MSYTDKLTALSNSIKAKSPGYTGSLSLAKMKEAVDAISAGVDTSVITATAADALNTKKILLPDGTLVNGGIQTVSATSTKLSTYGTTYYTIPEGYHNGSGIVNISEQTKSISPGSSNKTATADSGYCLTSVKVYAKSGRSMNTGTISLSNNSQTITIPLGMSYSSSNYLYIYNTNPGAYYASCTKYSNSYSYNFSDGSNYNNIYFVDCSNKLLYALPRVTESEFTFDDGNYEVVSEQLSCSVTSSGNNVTIRTSGYFSNGSTPMFKAGTFNWIYFG